VAAAESRHDATQRDLHQLEGPPHSGRADGRAQIGAAAAKAVGTSPPEALAFPARGRDEPTTCRCMLRLCRYAHTRRRVSYPTALSMPRAAKRSSARSSERVALALAKFSASKTFLMRCAHVSAARPASETTHKPRCGLLETCATVAYSCVTMLSACTPMGLGCAQDRSSRRRSQVVVR
jgi:hypothetical protein